MITDLEKALTEILVDAKKHIGALGFFSYEIDFKNNKRRYIRLETNGGTALVYSDNQSGRWTKPISQITNLVGEQEIGHALYFNDYTNLIIATNKVLQMWQYLTSN